MTDEPAESRDSAERLESRDPGAPADPGADPDPAETASETGEIAAAGAEGPVRTLDTRVRLKWWGQILLFVGILTVVGAVLTVVTDPAKPWMVAAVVLPVLVLGLLWVWLRYRLWAFQFRTDHLFLERGVYRNVETVVPYVRIQHVDTSRGPVERLLGLSTLVVYTAGSRGADVAIPGLPAEDAEAMQSRVKELAIEAEGGEGL